VESKSVELQHMSLMYEFTTRSHVGESQSTTSCENEDRAIRSSNDHNRTVTAVRTVSCAEISKADVPLEIRYRTRKSCRIRPRKVTPHAARATKTKYLGTTSNQGSSITADNRCVQTVYMPKGKTALQYTTS
jgi:hypothetical protein